LHEACGQYFSLLHYACVVPVIFLSTATGAVNLTNVNACSGNTNYVGVILGVVGLCTAGLSALNNVLRYGERSIAHKESAKAFGMLVRDISVEIILENTESPPPSSSRPCCTHHPRAKRYHTAP
jgi:putative copper export protein